MPCRFAALSLLLGYATAYAGSSPGPLKVFLLGRHESAVLKNIRLGRYREALRERTTFLSMQGIACRDDGACRLLEALSQSPQQTTVARAPSTVSGERLAGHLFLPVTINGIATRQMLDTGATHSVLTESEAARLGLSVRDVDGGLIGEAAGLGTAVRKIAVAERLEVGGFQFRNVAFLIFPDDSKLWLDLPAGYRGALGIHVLTSLETVAWDRGTEVRLGRDKPTRAGAPLSFGGPAVFLQVRFEGRELKFYLDTGSSWSCLHESFGRVFPDLVKRAGKPSTTKFWGVAGEREVSSITLPEVRLNVGGFTVALSQAPILSKNEGKEHFDGVAGLDLLDQAGVVVLDFSKMRLMLR